MKMVDESEAPEENSEVLPDGSYPCLWSGYNVEIKYEHKTYNLSTGLSNLDQNASPSFMIDLASLYTISKLSKTSGKLFNYSLYFFIFIIFIFI